MTIAFLRSRTPLLLCVLLLGSFATAQMVTEPPAEKLPPQLGDVGIEQRLNTQIPLDLSFHDENGQTVQLRQYFHPGKPVVLSFVYFNCRMLCSEVLSSMATSLRRVKFDAGKDFEILTVSIDHRDTPETAREAKQKYLAMYGHPGAASGWHFLTGADPQITSLAQAAGFHYRWDPRTDQFAHAAGIMLLTPDGHISQYYYGARYFPSDLRLGLIQSSHDQIGTFADQIVLYCYHWDPRIGRYGAIVSRVIQVAGGITLLILGGVMFFLFRAYPNRAKNSSEVPTQEKVRALGTHALAGDERRLN